MKLQADKQEIRRFPRLAESAEEKSAAKRTKVRALDKKASQWLARGHEANTQVGRAFNELKQLLGHGKWLRHFEQKFAHCITLRTAEHYMRQAREEDSKIEKLSNFAPATDSEAVTKSEVTAEAGREVEKAKRRHPIFKPPLRLRSTQELDAARQLWKSHGSIGEKRMIAVLRQMFAEFHIDSDEETAR
jgi:hypothetical protein